VTPQSIHGKKLTATEERMWRHVYASTHSGAQATGTVKKHMVKKVKGKAKS